MNRKLLFLFVSIVFLFGVTLVWITWQGIFAKNTILEQYKNCRLLDEAVWKYYEDRGGLFGSTEAPPLPTFDILLKENYISKDFADRLRKDKGEYFVNPSPNSENDDIFIEYLGKDIVLVMRVGGDGQAYRADKSRNPWWGKGPPLQKIK